MIFRGFISIIFITILLVILLAVFGFFAWCIGFAVMMFSFHLGFNHNEQS